MIILYGVTPNVERNSVERSSVERRRVNTSSTLRRRGKRGTCVCVIGAALTALVLLVNRTIVLYPTCLNSA